MPGVDFDVGQYANARLAKRLGNELLDPETEDLLARRHEQRELVTAGLEVVVEESREPDCRVFG